MAGRMEEDDLDIDLDIDDGAIDPSPDTEANEDGGPIWAEGRDTNVNAFLENVAASLEPAMIDQNSVPSLTTSSSGKKRKLEQEEASICKRMMKVGEGEMDCQTVDEPNSGEAFSIVMNFRDIEMPLIPCETSSESLLADRKFLQSSLTDLLSACKNALNHVLKSNEELILLVHDLGLFISEAVALTTTCTMNNILDIYQDLHKNDGRSNVPPLTVSLYTRVRFADRLAILQENVAAGKGFSRINQEESHAEVEAEDTSTQTRSDADDRPSSREALLNPSGILDPESLIEDTSDARLEMSRPSDTRDVVAGSQSLRPKAPITDVPDNTTPLAKEVELSPLESREPPVLTKSRNMSDPDEGGRQEAADASAQKTNDDTYENHSNQNANVLEDTAGAETKDSNQGDQNDRPDVGETEDLVAPTTDRTTPEDEDELLDLEEPEDDHRKHFSLQPV